MRYLGNNGYMMYSGLDRATMIIILIGMLFVLAVLLLWKEK